MRRTLWQILNNPATTLQDVADSMKPYTAEELSALEAEDAEDDDE